MPTGKTSISTSPLVNITSSTSGVERRAAHDLSGDPRPGCTTRVSLPQLATMAIGRMCGRRSSASGSNLSIATRLSTRLKATPAMGTAGKSCRVEPRRAPSRIAPGARAGCLPSVAQVFRGAFALGASPPLRGLFPWRLAVAAAFMRSSRRTVDIARSRSLAVQTALVSNRDLPAASLIDHIAVG